MLRLFNRFLVISLLVAVTVYVALTNSTPATLTLGPRFTLTANAGVIYLGVFAIGCLVASLIALFFGFKGYVRERRLISAEKARQAFFDLFVKARSFMAAEEWGAARNVWEQILKKDASNVIALVELSSCLENLGDSREALRVLDSVRASHRANPEILFKAAALNKKLGNETAARDNIALIVSDFPSKRAFEEARDLSAQMGRLSDALEYQAEIERAGYSDAKNEKIRAHLAYTQIVQDSASEGELRDALKGFVKRNPTFLEALERLSALEISAGNFDAAADLLVKVARNSVDDPSKWFGVVDLWIKKAPGDFTKRAERAVVAVRSAARSVTGITRIRTELLLAQTLLALHKYEDSHAALVGIPALCEEEGAALTDELRCMQIVLTGLCMSRLGQLNKTGPLWQELAEPENVNDGVQGFPLANNQREPSPALSTP